MTIRAYERRRGWLVWQTATLGRFEFDGGYPSLQAMQGLPERSRTVRPGDNVRAMKLHAAVAQRRGM